VNAGLKGMSSSPTAHEGGNVNAAARELGYIKFIRSPEAEEILSDPAAFALLALIARRARWRSRFNTKGLELGEALIGISDHETLRITEQQYKTRVKKLRKWGQITTRPTNKGTIAKLVSSLVFDINAPHKCEPTSQLPNQRLSSKQPASNQRVTSQQPLTNKETSEKEESKTRVVENGQPLPESIAAILNTALALVFDRSDLLGSLERTLGPFEWKRNGPMWRMRARSSPDDRHALADALEDFAAKTPIQRSEIKNVGAWLTSRYEALATKRKRVTAEHLKKLNAA
jgi:hypothetical protein